MNLTFESCYATYKQTKRELIALEIKKQELAESYGYPAGKNFDMPITSHSSPSQAALNYVIKLEELEKEEENLQLTLQATRNDLQGFLDRLESDDMRKVCSYRIFTKTSWAKIRDKLDKSYSYVRSLYYEGMELLHNMK